MNSNKMMILAAGSLACFALTAMTALTQEPESESFKKYGQEFKGKIGRTYEESVEWYPSRAGGTRSPTCQNVLELAISSRRRSSRLRPPFREQHEIVCDEKSQYV